MLMATSTKMIMSVANSVATVKGQDASLESSMRALNCLFGMLSGQQSDELCCNCTSYAATLTGAKKQLLEAETRMADCDCKESTRLLFLEIYNIVGNIMEPDNPVPQREVGACAMPNGACLLAASAHLAGVD
jgi:hypothetical protein